MQSNSDLEKCCQCFELLSKERQPRKMMGCIHNSCSKCLHQSLTAKVESISCYYCSTVVPLKDIHMFPKNTNLTLKKKKSNSDTKSSEEHEELLLNTEPSESDFCKLHEKPLDIVCVSDKTLVCAHCAIFGNHKDHRFKTVLEFDQEIASKINKFDFIKKKYFREKQDSHKYQDIQPLLNIASKNLQTMIEKKFTQLEYNLKNAKKLALSQLHNTIQEVLKKNNDGKQINQAKQKMNKWENSCSFVIKKIKQITNNTEKITIFYQSPLQLVQQGQMFLQQIQLQRLNYKKKLKNLINSFSFTFKQSYNIQNYAKLHYSDQHQILTEQQINDNPFIVNNPLSAKHIQIASSKQIPDKIISSTNIKASQRPSIAEEKKTQPTLKHVKSLGNLKKEHSDLRHVRPLQKKRMLASVKSQNEFNPIISKFSIASKQLKESIKMTRDPEKALASFQVNHLGDVFDLSDCSLDDDALFYYVQMARKVCRTKGIKMNGNNLTTQGFEKLIQLLQGVSSLNLNKNMLTSNIFQVIVKNKKKLESLKIIYLAQNQINQNKNMLGPHFIELKKMGITVVFRESTLQGQ